jgi:hypothetical protein
VKATHGTGVFVLAHAGDRRPTPASGLLPTDADADIVRTGSDWGVDNQTWLTIFRDVTDQLAAGTAAAGSASDATAGGDHSRTLVSATSERLRSAARDARSGRSGDVRPAGRLVPASWAIAVVRGQPDKAFERRPLQASAAPRRTRSRRRAKGGARRFRRRCRASVRGRASKPEASAWYESRAVGVAGLPPVAVGATERRRPRGQSQARPAPLLHRAPVSDDQPTTRRGVANEEGDPGQ